MAAESPLDAPVPPDRAADPDGAVAELFADLERRLAVLLVDPLADPLRFDRVQAIGQRLIALTQAAPDALLFVLFQGAGRLSARYSSGHALSCAAIAQLAAQQLRWPAEQCRSLVCAALTMNLSITALQNELVHREHQLTAEQLAAIAQHPARGAALLREAGVDDALWLEVVAAHHTREDDPPPLAHLTVAGRLTRLLARVDVFLAKQSPRAGRRPLSVTAATRDACLGPDGRPDEVGATLLRVLGFYPPGTLVRLVDGETAVVLRRGERADRPIVASVTGARQQALARPLLRWTARPEHAVQAALAPDTQRLAGSPLPWLALLRDSLAPPSRAAA